MSISSILHSATSALSVAQTRIAITSTNIANAETDGYTKKTAYVTTSVVGGQATGVQVIGTGSDVDEQLVDDIIEANADAAYDSAISSYYSTVLTALGTTSDGSALSEALTSIQTALSDAIEDISGTSSLSDITDALSDWVDAVTDASDSIQSARTSADQAISEDVETVNDLLYQIDALNDQITSASANGDSTSDLEDTRRTLVEELSNYLDITSFTTSAGALQIYTSSGQALLTSTVHELSYTASGTLTADSVYDSSGTGTISGITVDGEDITSDLSGGEIGALIELRDDILPGLQDELDELSNTIKESINAAANDATPVPAPNSLTTSATMETSDSLSGSSGTLTIVLTDEDGEVTSSTDIDLSSCSSVSDLLSSLNAISGVTASLDSDGYLVVTNSGDSSGGIIATGDYTLDLAGTEMSSLGFYDVLTGDDASSLALSETIETQGSPTAAVDSTTVGDAAYTSDDSTALQAMYSALGGTISFDAAGELSATTCSAASYVSLLIDDLSDRASAASTAATTSATTAETLATTFSNTYGVNVDEETALLTTYQQDYEAAAQIVTTAQEMWDALISMMN